MFASKTIGITLAIGALAIVGAQPINHEKLEGKGAFSAHGVGVASIEGNGKFTVEGHGEVLVIAGRDDKIEARGFGLDRVDGNRHYYRGKGKITVTGDDISIKLDGDIDALRGLGKGTAHLVGRGDYHVGKLIGHWTGGNGNTIWFIEPKK